MMGHKEEGRQYIKVFLVAAGTEVEIVEDTFVKVGSLVEVGASAKVLSLSCIHWDLTTGQIG